jgi:MFS family permease
MTFVLIETKKAGAWSSLATLLTGNFITILDLFIVNVALPDIQRELHASNADLQLIMVSYSVSYGAMLLNGARLGDLYGRRRLFLFGISVFALASLFCALAPSPWILIGARAIQGIGAALLMPQVYTSLRLLFEEDKRRRAFAIMGAVQGIAGAASQVVGGSLISLNFGDLGWRLVFLINLPIALYPLVTGKWMIVETRAPVPARLDIRGAILGTCALTLILLPLTIGREYGWPWWSLIGPLLSLPMFAYFASHEARLSQHGGVPLIDVSLFKMKRFVLGMLATFLFFSAISSFSLSLTMMLQVGLGQSALEAGTFFVPSTIAFFAGSLLSAPIEKRYGGRALTFGMLAFAIGLLIAVLAGFAGSRDLGSLSISVVLQGLGQGIVIPLLLNLILGTVSDNETGMASGIFTTMQAAGSSVGLTVVGVAFFSVLDRISNFPGSDVEPATAYGDAFAVATICNLAAVALGLALFSQLQRSPLRPKER